MFTGGYPTPWCATQVWGFRWTFARLGPTEPAGKPSLRGRPTGRLILGRGGEPPSKSFFELPFGRPGRRLTDSGGLPLVGGAAAAPGASRTCLTTGPSLEKT